MKKSASAGRRAGNSTSKVDILAAARRRFAQHGYDGTTMRQVASDAGVDAALVHYFFGGKEKLYAAAQELPFAPAQVFLTALEDGANGAGERLVRGYLELWEDPATQQSLLALLRSATVHPDSAEALRQFVIQVLQPRIGAATGAPDGDLRAVLVGSALVGMAFERYVLAIEPLASAEAETVVAWVGPTVQRYITGEPG